MADMSAPKKFNNKDVLLSGWYWLLPAKHLKKGKIKPVRFYGKEMVVFRGKDGQVKAMDAYCPHMGAHLAEGNVVGNEIRCMFHGWEFNRDGECTKIPCLDEPIQVKPIKTYTTCERYDLIWIWTGDEAPAPFPEVPDLAGQDVDVMAGRPFVKNCHPNVMMINAIDAQHFNTVHPMVKKLAGGARLEAETKSAHQIEFKNTNPIQDNGLLNQLLKPFYKGPLTYWLSYWFGTIGTVTIGPDFFHFHIMFALRPTLDGKAEGRTILITKKRQSIFGKAFNKVILLATKVVGDYFARGDTQIFRTIKFKFDTPILEDQPIIRFIQHAERQPQASTWLPQQT
jgi:phenylpropionate dioxygenase-like ring-hydroxylating dioxygenase large terminal subunit